MCFKAQNMITTFMRDAVSSESKIADAPENIGYIELSSDKCAKDEKLEELLMKVLRHVDAIQSNTEDMKQLLDSCEELEDRIGISNVLA